MEIILKYPAYEKLIVALTQAKGSFERAKLDLAFSDYVESLTALPQEEANESLAKALASAKIAVSEIGLGLSSVISLLVYKTSLSRPVSESVIEKKYGPGVNIIYSGLKQIAFLSSTSLTSDAENLRKLLLNLAKDIRVIMICLADQLNLMRTMKSLPRDLQLKIATGSSYLYAPLAHRLGLYIIKSEMEDLALKYTDRETYTAIANRLSETMRARKTFIDDFIKPLEEVLRINGFDFEIKGRPKSIHSIWNKMRSKEVAFEDIYDLFAIRIILNSEEKNEKSDCWKVYSLVTDIYQPNPLRLRDWISVPKSNGYESLHTTVIAPGGRWVEVQIRTHRMNEIAEKGFAAHWKYKGLEGEKALDQWLVKVREVLETPQADAVEFMDDFKLSLYSKEIFVFTPRGDLRKFPAGATVLDFAYDIHSNLGDTCIGARINGKNVPIRYTLKNGERVEVLTAKTQTPKADWLGFTVTSKAKAKIRQKLNEEKFKEAEIGKEIIKRRFKNWKILFTDEVIRQLLKKYKLKIAQDFYSLVAKGDIDMAEVKVHLEEPVGDVPERTQMPEPAKVITEGNGSTGVSDFLIIDEAMSNIDYKLAKCCNPIFGDDIFGFVTISEGIKIHRTTCPNAASLVSRYGYRIVKAKWNRSTGLHSLPVDIIIDGEETPGILNTLSDLISREFKVALRSIAIENENGTFHGRLTLMVLDKKHLDSLIARMQKLKGIFSVKRQEIYHE